MNIRKNIDYSAMFAALDAALNAELPQMKLCCELGRIVCSRPEKGAAVAAAEHLHSRFPDASGFSPRNLRSRTPAQPFPRCFRLLPAQPSPDAGVLSDV